MGGCRTAGARCAGEEVGRQALALSARSLEKDRKTSLFDGLSLEMLAAFSIFSICISLSPSRSVMHFLILKEFSGFSSSIALNRSISSLFSFKHLLRVIFFFFVSTGWSVFCKDGAEADTHLYHSSEPSRSTFVHGS